MKEVNEGWAPAYEFGISVIELLSGLVVAAIMTILLFY